MPADTVQLVRRDGVELIRTGSWALSTGKWHASREDLASAVAAADCPAIRRPVIWIGHTDTRFTPRDSSEDGEPGVGWIENLRLGDGGHTLIGDYVGMPGWLDQVMASAYPDRSVEGAYNRRCQLGHQHRFVLDGVALLGVTRPGVGTLRSLQTLDDVRSLYGLAASTIPDGEEMRVVATVTGTTVRARFDPTQVRDKTGKWTDGVGGLGAVVGDKLKLSGRIKLRQGERLAGSTSVSGEDGRVMPVAAIDGPDGRSLRMGVGILSEDRRSWSASPKGSTVQLDRAAARQFGEATSRMAASGEEGKSRHKALTARVRGLERQEADLVGRQYRTKSEAREVLALQRAIDADETRVASLDRMLANPGVPENQEQADLFAGLRRWRLEDKAKLDVRLAEQRARLAELDAQATPLTDADKANLDRVRRDLDASERELQAFGDSTVVADGVISTPWGDLVYETFMQEGSVRHQFEVRPPGAGADWRPGASDRESILTAGQLLRLASEVEALMPDRVAAADGTHSGAMVALIPAAADAARLAVDGGLPADELHVTLAYLGDAVHLSAADRQDVIDAVSSAVNGFPTVDADVFALSVFNPGRTDRDTCIVAGLSGDLLDAAHTLVGDALTYSEVATPAQHAPWHAHMTLLYTNDLSRVAALADRVGPVRFDRIRIALAGQHIDIPLIPDEPELEDADDGLAVAAAAGDGNALKRYWTRGEGLKRWATRKHPWTALYRHLRKHVGAERAKRMASQWFRDVFGYWPGHRKGKNKTGPG